jgi:hypothetical protein
VGVEKNKRKHVIASAGSITVEEGFKANTSGQSAADYITGFFAALRWIRAPPNAVGQSEVSITGQATLKLLPGSSFVNPRISYAASSSEVSIPGVELFDAQAPSKLLYEVEPGNSLARDQRKTCNLPDWDLLKILLCNQQLIGQMLA